MEYKTLTVGELIKDLKEAVKKHAESENWSKKSAKNKKENEIIYTFAKINDYINNFEILFFPQAYLIYHNILLEAAK